MKSTLAAALSLASLIGITPAPTAARATTGTASAAEDAPFACDRSALTSAQRKRHFEELGPALRALKKGVRELPDGFEFEFPGDRKALQLLTEWTAGERVCCPFFDIDLQMTREGGPLKLRLTGREGVKQFIEAEGAAWLKQ